MLIIFYIICIINYNVAYEPKDVKTSVFSALNSLESFFDKFKYLVQCKYSSILHRQDITKKAFQKFFSMFDTNNTYQCDYSNYEKNKMLREEDQTIRISTSTSTATPSPTIRRHSLEIEMTRLVSFHGYGLETHTTLTADGYMITLHRIRTSESQGKEKKKVLLHHGLLGSAQDWLLLGSSKALPYLLWSSGYDVWLINARGSKFSKTHSNYSVNSDDFWDFSFHEMGIYDLPAAISYIKDLSDSKAELHYIGYSMGATALLVLLSTYPAYNTILTSAILLAPLAFMYNAKGPLRALSQLRSTKFNDITYFGNREFLGNESFPNDILDRYCTDDYILCFKKILFLANGGKRINNTDFRNSILNDASDVGSAKTIKHYAQLVSSGEFQLYDYGIFFNTRKYGKRVPSYYSLNDVKLPIALISATEDWLSSVADNSRLLSLISNIIVHKVVKRPDFSHTDFLWAEDAPELVYTLVLDIISMISK